MIPAAKAVAPLESEPEKLLTIENDYARYVFTSYGGGLKLIELKKYPESVACRSRNGFSTNKFATLNTKAPVPMFALVGSDAVQGDGNFSLTNTGGRVRAENGFLVVVALPQPHALAAPQVDGR